MKNNRSRIFICAFVSFFAIWLLSPTAWNLMNPEKADQFPSWMPKSAMRLGLDLQGGVHMVLGVDLDKVVNDQLAAYGRDLEKSLDTDGIKNIKTIVNAQKFELEVAGFDSTNKEKIAQKITQTFKVLEFVGDTDTVLVTRMARGQEDYVRTHALDQSIETIRNRIDEFGVSEPIITKKGDSQILVQFPGAKEPDRLKDLIGQTAQLNFQIVHECVGGACLAKQRADLEAKIKTAEEAGKYNRESFKRLSDYRNKINEDLRRDIPADTTIAFEREKSVNVNNSSKLIPMLLSTKDIVSGQYIEDAFVQMDQSDRFGGNSRPVVSFRMNAVGTPIFAKLTSDFRGRFMAIVLDGVIRSAPTIQSPITQGSGQITLGTGSIEETNREARDTAIVLRAGALPAQIEIQEERVIGPSMGHDAIDAGKKALLLSAILVLTFMWAYYGTAGLISNVVTLVDVAIIFASLGAMGATLTLPGIAGVVLTLGMATDALIIIFERMREEARKGRNVRQMVEMGFDKAFATILDSNVTTAIGGVVLLQYGTGSIRGFALTLLVGILVNVFMATFYMQSLFKIWTSQDNPKIGLGLSRKELAEIRA